MKNRLQIPKTFELGGRTWTVTYTKQPPMEIVHSSGLEIYVFSQIKLFGTNHGHAVSRETLEVTLMHEYLHAALDEMQYQKLSEDEDFIERLSKALHQILTSAQGTLAVGDKK